MNAKQISSILSRNCATSKYFKGVYASNQIKEFRSYPYCFVANTEKYGKSGEHWVAFYIKNPKEVEYFDSLGEWPPKVNVFKKFIENFSKVKFNEAKIQASFETSCGPHCIYFLIKRCQGLPFNELIRELRHPLSDILVKLYVYRIAVS